MVEEQLTSELDELAARVVKIDVDSVPGKSGAQVKAHSLLRMHIYMQFEASTMVHAMPPVTMRSDYARKLAAQLLKLA